MAPHKFLREARIIVLLALWVLTETVFAQRNTELYRLHARYVDSTVWVRRFKHEDMMHSLSSLGKEFRVRQIGTSVEGRSINLVSYGHGPVQVLMWSQMHGDETTATRAILDVFRFLQDPQRDLALKKRIQEAVTWHFIPMLNPDGAARFTRRNRDGIDINRDAVRQQTPEGRILKRVRDSLKADWGFNLHDQSRGTMVGSRPATVSLLAPPFDSVRSVNESRGDAMQMTRFLHDQIIGFIPGQVGLYPDDFEPRAFGDNMQRWGTRTVLIESGGFGADYEKQEIRRLNFIMLLTAVESIALRSYEKISVDAYHEIPHHASGRLLELIVRNVNFQKVVRDIGFDRREIDSDDFRRYYTRAAISDLGDLSTSHAYFYFDAAGYDVTLGKSYDGVIEGMQQFRRLPIESLISQGYTDFVVKGEVDRFGEPLKVNVQSAPMAQDIQLGANPSLLFWKQGVLDYVLVNGILYRAKG